MCACCPSSFVRSGITFFKNYSEIMVVELRLESFGFFFVRASEGEGEVQVEKRGTIAS